MSFQVKLKRQKASIHVTAVHEKEVALSNWVGFTDRNKIRVVRLSKDADQPAAYRGI